MPIYYLIPTPDFPYGKYAPDKIRIFQGGAAKAKLEAERMERELNGGELHSIELSVGRGVKMWKVHPTPFSEARNSLSFADWPCNKSADPSAAIGASKTYFDGMWDAARIAEEIGAHDVAAKIREKALGEK